MEELVLRPFLARQELNIVDEHDVSTAVGFPENIEIALADRFDEFIGKLLRC